MTTIARPGAARGEVWVMLAAAILAVAVGTLARGYSNIAWDITTRSLLASLGGSLPFLLAAGVLFGLDGWPSSRRLLVAGAGLVALAGAISVAVQVLSLRFMPDAGPDDVQPWLSLGSTAGSVAVTLAFSVLALAVWRMPAAGGLRGLAVAVGAILGIAALSPLTGLLVLPQPVNPAWMGSLVLPSLTLLATTALAVAATRRMHRASWLREPLIAVGAAAHVLAWSYFWFLFSGIVEPTSAIAALGIAQPLTVVAHLSMAAGFAAAALHPSTAKA